MLKNEKLTGKDIIKFISKSLPHKPGVYQMENEKGDILYIGKAKNLAKRVVNYTSLNNLTRRLQRMVTLSLRIIPLKKWLMMPFQLLGINKDLKVQPAHGVEVLQS